MNHWNYRIVVYEYNDGTTEREIKEVYYDENGKPNGYRDASVFAETKEELGEVLEMMKEALKKVELKHADFQS